MADLSEVVRLYGQAEEVLLKRMARSIQKGLDAPGWTTIQYREIQRYNRHAQKLLNELPTHRVVENEIAAEARQGWKNGRLAVPVTAGDGQVVLPTNVIDALAAETSGTITGTHSRILRSTQDAYRDVVAQSIAPSILGAETRRQGVQRMLTRFAQRGITGFVSGDGRNWEMQSYVEMATRTAKRTAKQVGYTENLQQNGYDLVIISDHLEECEMCRPWEGQILSLTISGPHQQVHAHRLTGEATTINVLGSLDEARMAGLFHPNCRHNESLYIPGVTVAPEGTADPEGDSDRQQLRSLERRIRATKREKLVALDKETEQAANRKIAAYQGRIRELVDTTTVTRQRHRESITAPR